MPRDLEALLLWIEERQETPHAWAQPFDCVSFALLGVKAQNGWNPIGRLTWTTRRGALRVIRHVGGLERALDARMTGISPAMARRGDVGGIADPLLGVRLCIVEGETLVSPGDRGLRRVPRSQMIRAWSADPVEQVAG